MKEVCDMNENIDVMRKKVKKYLDKNRYNHTLGVMYTAGALAMRYGTDMDRALTAGLLHDCAKCIPNDKKIRMCKKNHIFISPAEYANPSLLHAKLGAYLAKHEYKIEDSDILDAITYHTTGRPDMTLLEKIVYIADYIEPNRKEIPGLAQIRKIVFTDIDRAVCLSAGSTVRYLKNGGKAVDPMTINTYNFYKKKED